MISIAPFRYHNHKLAVVCNGFGSIALRPLFLFWIATSLLATACGQEPAFDSKTQPADDSNGSDDSVIEANETDIEAGQALAGSYIVTFRTPGSGNRLQFSNYFQKYQHHYLALANTFAADTRVKDVQFLTAVDLSTSLSQPQDSWGGTWLKSNTPEDVIGSMFRVDFSTAADAKDLLAEWNSKGFLWFAEPNYISQTSNITEEPITSFDKLADRYDDLSVADNYWWLSTTAVADGYRTLHEKLGKKSDDITTANSPLIAVLDSGVDYEHPALAGQIWQNTSVGAADCEHDEHGCNTTVSIKGKLGNGDIHPYDTSGPGESCFGKDPNCSHGTHVAGIIAGDSNWTSSQGMRIAGVCPVCKIMVVKIVSKVGRQSGILDSSILAAFEYVSLFNHGDESAVRILNASFGKFVRSRSVGILVRLMKEKRGMLLIGAAGNEDTLRMEYPAAFSDAIAVAAVDSDQRKVSFSNFGRWVDISAPGSAIISTVPGGSIDAKSGTSMAAPFVTGVAGLMVAANPNISFGELRTWLINSADPSFYGADANGGYNHTYYYPKIKQESVRQPLLGSGVLHANHAIREEPADNLPLFTAMDRVKPGCSVISAQPVRHAKPWFWLLFALPLLVPYLRRLTYGK